MLRHIVTWNYKDGFTDSENKEHAETLKAGLEALKEPCAVELYSDSKYVVDALEKGWARGWRKRGWVKSGKQPALNPDLWERLLALCDTHQVVPNWVRGHAGDAYNNRCDALAVAAIPREPGVPPRSKD